MISEFNFFHGAVISELIHKKVINSVIPYPTESNSSYVINRSVGIYIKYSTKRLSPWRFTFRKEHQDEILEMKQALGEVFLLLVCNHDGIVCLSFDELKSILDHEHEEVEWISLHRNRREKYAIKGSDGEIRLKFNVSDFSKILTLAEVAEA